MPAYVQWSSVEHYDRCSSQEYTSMSHRGLIGLQLFTKHFPDIIFTVFDNIIREKPFLLISLFTRKVIILV